MKIRWIFIILCAVFFFGGCVPYETNNGAQNLGDQDNAVWEDGNESFDGEKPIRNQSEEFLKGAWVPTVFNITYPSVPTINSSILKNEIDEIVAFAAENGVNALFFQVRPCADAIYKSEVFPWSKYLTGKQGVAPSNNFDPLDYIIGKCHDDGIELHAWINPLRITALDTDTLVPSHPANVTPWLTFNVGGKLYFNPGEPEARELIVEGVREIAENYHVDGIHFDDYFYPEDITTQDLPTYQADTNNQFSLADWRRNNVDELILQTYLAVKEIKHDIKFGVSPAGIWANSFNNPLGSDTWGFESYYTIYADSRGWVEKGYIDYIAPQLYWYIGQSGSDYLTMLNWWCGVCLDTDVSLYIGLAGYKQDETWLKKDEIANQADLAADYTDGIIIFSFNDLYKDSVQRTL